MRCRSVRLPISLSVTFVNSAKTDKHVFDYFHRLVARPFYFSVANVTSWEYSDGDPLTGASNAGWVGTYRDSGRIASYRSMTAGASAINNNDGRLSTSV